MSESSTNIQKDWIKTADRLPPFRLTVLGLNKDVVRLVRFYNEGNSIDGSRNFSVRNMATASCIGCCGDFDGNITHWALIPKLPESGYGL